MCDEQALGYPLRRGPRVLPGSHYLAATWDPAFLSSITECLWSSINCSMEDMTYILIQTPLVTGHWSSHLQVYVMKSSGCSWWWPAMWFLSQISCVFIQFLFHYWYILISSCIFQSQLRERDHLLRGPVSWQTLLPMYETLEGSSCLHLPPGQCSYSRSLVSIFISILHSCIQSILLQARTSPFLDSNDQQRPSTFSFSLSQTI